MTASKNKSEIFERISINYGMGAVLMYNFGKDNLKDLGVKVIQKDFNASKFKSSIILLSYMTYIQ